ncbi:MAG: hypothetical protein KKF41_10290 [Actinobacteria bacterium]|nr:hypothetical protein [Actinomycetota bacterium]MBU1943091.1 hypothetical protein [Actinomycetota bacterium]MBU2687962.1 hypothetical protein [Actinomycetota bacterium]
MNCQCAECKEYMGPNPRVMMFRFLVIFAQVIVGFVGLVKERSWKALVAWLGGFALFWTVPRYLICARCAGYGNKCYSLYLGEITSRYMPKVEGHDRPSNLGIVLELLALSTISNAPAVGMRHNRRLLALYMLLAGLTFWGQFLHACRHCAEYGTDWKKECPSAKAYRLFFGGGREVAL